MIEKSSTRDNRVAYLSKPSKLGNISRASQIHNASRRHSNVQVLNRYHYFLYNKNMPNRNQHSQGQSVFSIQTSHPPSPHESPTFNMNILNTNFEQPRARGIKRDKPWNTSTSVFHATSADGAPQNATLPQLCETPQSTYSVLNFRQLLTPQTPSNQTLNPHHSVSPDFHPPMFIEPEINCSRPLSESSPLRSLDLVSSLFDDSVSYSEHESSLLLLPLSLDITTQPD
jgi:hypothetical protein